MTKRIAAMIAPMPAVRASRCVSPALSVLAISIGAAAAVAQDTSQAIDKIFSWTSATDPGCAVAVSHQGKLVASRGYGLADLEHGIPITTNSVFDVGSLQKQFVAAAALILVEKGQASLNDDIRKYVPQLSDFGHEITIDHLLTHTSGMRDWTGLRMLTAQKADALTLILRQRSLNFAPGDEWSYSNSGYVLIKEIISRISGMSFAEFAGKHMFEPLKMDSTLYVHDMQQQIDSRALAYEKKLLGWQVAMLLGEDRGGGALMSTAEDLVIWNEALTTGRLGTKVTKKMHEPAKLNNGRKLDYTRGLAIATSPAGDRFFWHSGSADGYKSVLGRFPEHGLSFAILCNGGDHSDRRSAKRIVDHFVPAIAARREETETPPIADDGIDTDGLNLRDREGLFLSEAGGEPLRLIVRRGRLRIAGGPVLVATTGDRFRCWHASLNFRSQDDFQLRFLSADRLELKSMEGQSTLYRRSRPVAVSASELSAYAGRYKSKELVAVFQVEPRAGGVVVRLEHAPQKSLEFKPVDKDTFQWRRMTVRFQRDAGGTVSGFAYSNPVMRDVGFTRLSDG